MRSEFGIFAPVFESAHGYLALLNLTSADAPQAVGLVRSCCGRTGTPHEDICRLLREANWRPHLVAAVATIVLGYNEEVVRLLWHRIDCGSWVTPQIGAALFLVDPNFGAGAATRLESGCRVDVSELRPMTALERHSATGPAGTPQRSGKAAATLLRLAQMISPTPDWLQPLCTSKDLQALLAQDIDDSGGITDQWLSRIKDITCNQ